MNKVEIVKFGKEEYEFTWIEGGDPVAVSVSQVSGYVFNTKS